MRKLFLTLIASALAWQGAAAQKTFAWNNPDINQQNREQRRANFFAFENISLAENGDKAKSERYLSMEGAWKFHFARNHQEDRKSVV